jgi:VIT1/CCC1 family predicted Fe2+/Mn2+ transporter
MASGREAFLRHKALEHSTRGIYIRQFIFGTEDGLIGGLGLITGISVATLNPSIIILSGVALMLTQAVSMGTGTYLGIKSQREVYDRFLEKEKEEIREVPEVEREEVREIYRRHGFRGKELENIVKRITSNRRAWLSVMMAEELGISKKGLEKPATATAVMALSVMLGAFIPLVPYFFLVSYAGITVSVVLTTAALFAFGALKTLFTKRNWIKSGLEMMVIALAAAAAGYFIGNFLTLI